MAKKKVLLIDDNRDFCEVTWLWRHYTWKYRVVTAANGPMGIDLARKVKPDVILLDVRMPVMDGGRVAEHLMEDNSTSDIPIISLQASSGTKSGKKRWFHCGPSLHRQDLSPRRAHGMMRP
jgi:CheY-like chemotaxis protein